MLVSVVLDVTRDCSSFLKKIRALVWNVVAWNWFALPVFTNFEPVKRITDENAVESSKNKTIVILFEDAKAPSKQVDKILLVRKF